MKRTLYLDADSLVYQMAHGHQKVYEWTSELWTYVGDASGARQALREAIFDLMDEAQCSDVVVALSCTQGNFRKVVVPTYKSNRTSAMRPVLFKPLRDMLRNEFAAQVLPWLEGDDLVSIWATRDPSGVVCSIDKDLETTPCNLYNPNKPDRGVVLITEAEAEQAFLRQVLTGDRTDGYPGCPGMGPVRTQALGELTWETVVAEYVSAGQSEVEALENARCARLLRAGEYALSFVEKHIGVQLWHSEEFLMLEMFGTDTNAIGGGRAELG